MNEFDNMTCYPEEIADPFYEEDSGTSSESGEEIKQFFAEDCINEIHYA